jgi:hypothetical protein
MILNRRHQPQMAAVAIHRVYKADPLHHHFHQLELNSSGCMRATHPWVGRVPGATCIPFDLFKVAFRTEGVADFLASTDSISVLLAKGRSHCVISMRWRNLWEISWMKESPQCIVGL